MSLTRTAVTPAELLTLPRPANGRHYELSNGEPIIVGNAGAKHERVKRQILKALFSYEERYSSGAVFSESQFTLNDETARIPDVAFVRSGKLELLPDADVPIPFVPDLAIEVISASEPAADAETKVVEYLAAGVEEVWQVYPKERRVRVRRADGIRDLESTQTLRTPVLPGFEAVVGTFFAG